MPKVFLHIGMNKAGSSAIQSYFHSNRLRLKARDLLWPSTGLGAPGNGEGCHYDLSGKLGFGAKADIGSDDDLRDLRNQLDAEIDSANPETVVMSSEFFVLNRDASLVRRFFEDLNPYIVVFLRRHDKWWASLYAQAIKTTPNPPWNRSFKGFYEFQKKTRRQYVEFAPFIRVWADIFGQDRVLVCPYEEDQNSPDLVLQFLEAIGRPELGETIKPSKNRVNEKLTSHSLSLIDAVQRSSVDEPMKDLIISQIVKADDQNGKSLPLVPPFMDRELVEENLEDYRWIAQTFLNRPDGQLFHAPPPELTEKPSNITLPQPRYIEFFANHFRP